MILPGCCCQTCVTGSVIPKYVNSTKVRPTGDTGGTHYTSAPYPKYDLAQAIADGINCDTPGTCGAWLVGGDYGGLSSQEIQDTVDDIMAACSGTKLDHNCYTESGTVDMTSRRFGWQRVGARKQWHGTLGCRSKSYPHVIIGATFATGTLPDLGWIPEYDDFGPPPQTHYRTLAGTADVSYPPFSYVNHAESTSTVNRYTGILTTTGSIDITPDSAADFSAVGAWNDLLSDFSAFDTPVGASDYYIVNNDGVFELWANVVAYDDSTYVKVQTIQVQNGHAEYHKFVVSYPVPGDPSVWEMFEWEYKTLDMTETSASITVKRPSYIDDSFTRVLEYTADYSDPYTSSDVIDDANAAAADWDMSDFNLAGLRTDGQLANIPICIYDEVGGTAPFLNNSADTGMDDYSVPQVDGQWQKRAWHDPHDCVWVYNGNSYEMPSGFTGGSEAVLITGLRTGAIISHTTAGSERHFWFSSENLRRDHTVFGSACEYQWVIETHGALSADPLPPCSMRWPTKLESQYDGLTCGTPAPGYFPGPFRRQRGNEFIVVKEAQAVWPWKAVNYGRPCGAERYAVDQTTVCCIESAGAGSFTVKATGLAALPGATGGLAVDEYIIAESGGDGEIYKVTGISSAGTDPDGEPIWTVSVGSLLDTVPAFAMADPDQISDGADHLGRLRWPSASSICGRAAITTAFDSGTGLVTITSAAALPYLRIDPTTGEIRVDLYDASMASVLANVSLTRLSDTTFTFTHSAVPTAVWMTGHGVDWTHYTDAPRHTGIYLKWQFNLAATDSEYPAPPTWFAATPGCISGSKTQFTYAIGTCPAVVAVLPAGSPESFGNEMTYTMADEFLFDPVYGSLEMHMVELAMPDPFWQQPFKPDCTYGDTSTWTEDTGAGVQEFDELVGETTIHHKCFAYRPLVEAVSTIPAGMSLPAGVSLHFAGDIPPTDYCYPNGIPIGDAAGNYKSLWRPAPFILAACDTISAERPFKAAYERFVTCPV